MKEDIGTLNQLINNFVSSLDDRTPIFVAYNEPVIQKMLQWYFITWKHWLEDKSSKKTEWFMIYEILRAGIQKIVKRAIDVKQGSFTVVFFKKIIEHIESNKQEKVESEDKVWYYRDYIFHVFFDSLVDFVSSSDISERDYMWSEFPADWKITESNLKDKEKVLAHLSFRRFLDWTQGRIFSSHEREFDEPLYEMVLHLFPEVDPETWETILIFVFSPYAPEARVRSVIERNWTIGYSLARSFTFEISLAEGENYDEVKKKVITQKQAETEAKIATGSQKAYSLALLVFGTVFTKDLLQKCISEASGLKYADDTKENRKKLKLLRIFSGLLSQLP